MQVETSRESLDEMLYQARHCPTLTDADWQEWRGTLRALLSERDAATARAEAAERERDALRDEWEEIAAGITTEQPEVGALWPMVSEISGSLAAVRNLFRNEVAAHNRTKEQRDAATAERDRVARLVERASHCMPPFYNTWHADARVALTSAKEPSA